MINHVGHYRVVCREHGTVYTQCRCPSEHKSTREVDCRCPESVKNEHEVFDLHVDDRFRTIMAAWCQWHLGDPSWADQLLEDLHPDAIEDTADELEDEGVLES